MIARTSTYKPTTAPVLDITPALDPEFLKDFPVFRRLYREEAELLDQEMRLLKHPKNTLLYKTGEHSKNILFVKEGILKLYNHTDDGKEIIKEIIYPGSLIGEDSLMGFELRRDCLMSLKQEVQLWYIPKDLILRFFQRNKLFASEFMQIVGKKLARIDRKLETMLSKDSKGRILEYLKTTAHEHGRQIGMSEILIRHCLTHQDIANITGTCRQTVTAVLNQLKKKDIIYIRSGNILIRDMEKLI